MGFSYIFSWSCTTVFPKRFKLLCLAKKTKRKRSLQLVFEPVIFLKIFSLLVHDCPLAGNTRRLFEIFSAIESGNLCCNCIDMVVFKTTVHDPRNSSLWNTKFVFALRKFALKEDKLELDIIIKIWWRKETLDSTMKTFVENLRQYVDFILISQKSTPNIN